MIRLVVKGIVFAVFANSACMTVTQEMRLDSVGRHAERTQQEWNTLQSSSEFQREKSLFQERLDGKDLCWNTGIVEFSTSYDPSKYCVYPASSYFKNKITNDLGQYQNQLKVLNKTSEGFLVEHMLLDCLPATGNCYASKRSAPRLIFIHKTDEQDIVDGAYLDDGKVADLYVYAGPYTYETLLGGSNTVYSFKKITGQIRSFLADLKVYSARGELYAQFGLWIKLESLIQKQREGIQK